MVIMEKRGKAVVLKFIKRFIRRRDGEFKIEGEGFMCEKFSSPYLCFDSNLAVQNESGGPKSLIA